MLYLYGESGTTYLYIHLNNDLTAKRDNKGTCVPGVAYMDGLQNGAQVKAGQQIAYNGDSGDAEGIVPPPLRGASQGRRRVDPFPYLNEATKLLFAAPTAPTKSVTLGLKGVPLSAGAGMLELSVTAVRVWPGGAWTTCRRAPSSSPCRRMRCSTARSRPRSSPRRGALLSSRTVIPLLVFTRPASPTLDVTMGSPGALSVDRIRLG